MYNYNLPPTERFHDENAICLGEVPGPRKPKDMDSFLYPATQELLLLAVGVEAWDVVQQEKFTLRAFLIMVFGDIPAMSMLLRVKGHNAYSPCRLCTIKGVRIPKSSQTTYYVPLVRATHTPILLVPRVAQIDSLPIKIQIRLARGQRTRPNHQS